MPHQTQSLLDAEPTKMSSRRVQNDSPSLMIDTPQVHLPPVGRYSREGSGQRWDTANLGLRISADFASAASAAALVAPIITVIDR
jgi:hypothetical protein